MLDGCGQDPVFLSANNPHAIQMTATKPLLKWKGHLQGIWDGADNERVFVKEGRGGWRGGPTTFKETHLSTNRDPAHL